MRRIAHIINPVFVAPDRDYSMLGKAQPITFSSLEIAARYAAGMADIDILAVGFPEDVAHIPNRFRVTSPLTRSVLDIKRFQIPRKLPMLADILRTGLAASDAEYFIYTNIDIAVATHFYEVVNCIVDKGFDTFTVTRRTVPLTSVDPVDLPLLQALVGEPHPGHDCFVMHRRILEELVIGDTCVGAQHLVPPLLANMICRARRFTRISDFHLTFHLGDDRVWQDARFQDYAEFNFAEAVRTIHVLNDAGLLKPSPLIRNWIARYKLDIDAPTGADIERSIWSTQDEMD